MMENRSRENNSLLLSLSYQGLRLYAGLTARISSDGASGRLNSVRAPKKWKWAHPLSSQKQEGPK
jgi:hypothetical protein